MYAELGNYDVNDFSGRTTYSYDVKLDNMLDISNSSIRSDLGVSLESLIGEVKGLLNLDGLSYDSRLF